jgi:hypothetical protein
MTKKLIDTTATTVTAGTTVFQPSRVRDEKGLWQTTIPAGGSATLKLLGRASPDAPWHEMVSHVTGDMSTNTTTAELVDLFPEMTVSLATNSSAVSVKGWLVD